MKRLLKRLLWEALHILRGIVGGGQEVAVLCYHSIGDTPEDSTVSFAAFKRQLEELRNGGYTFVPLADVVTWVKGSKQLKRRSVAITFDDAYPDFREVALPYLTEQSIPVTLFAIGSIGHGGHPLFEIGYHSQTHPNLNTISDEELAREVERPTQARFFAYPGGNHSLRVREAVRKAGYEAAFTIRPVLLRQGMDTYLLPRSVVTKSMGPREVAMHASRAADWYYGLTHVWKK